MESNPHKTKKKRIPQSHRYKEQIDVCQKWAEIKWVKGGQKVQISSYRTNKLYDIMYRMVTIVNSTILHI